MTIRHGKAYNLQHKVREKFVMRRLTTVIMITWLLAILGSCGSLPTKTGEVSLQREDHPEGSNLTRIFGRVAGQDSSFSGFILLRNGDRALYERVALADMAEHTIDAQYYIWNDDKSGRFLAQTLVDAADRGVSVRILLDDFSIGDRNQQLLKLNSHPNLEVRVNNPFIRRSGISKWFNFAVDFERLNRRMHNKTYTVDGVAAIVGGRNIGDEYFNHNEHLNFRDLDLFTVGPVVAKVSREFQEYWDSPWSVPIDLIVSAEPDQAKRESLAEFVEKIRVDSLDFLFPGKTDSLETHFSRIVDELVWAPAMFVYDQPGGHDGEAYSEGPKRVAAHLLKMAGNSEKEILIESAYFVLDDIGLELAGQLREKGVSMRVLTNSMASNDVLPNHASYAMVRKAILENGIELFELRPDAPSCVESVGRETFCAGNSLFGLHAKAAVFDRKIVYVGSCNLNLRSAYLNTEVGMFVDSPALAQELIGQIEVNLKPENSWQPIIKDHNVVWITRNNGAEKIVSNEPQTSFAERFKKGVLTLVPGSEYY